MNDIVSTGYITFLALTGLVCISYPIYRLLFPDFVGMLYTALSYIVMAWSAMFGVTLVYAVGQLILEKDFVTVMPAFERSTFYGICLFVAIIVYLILIVIERFSDIPYVIDELFYRKTEHVSDRKFAILGNLAIYLLAVVFSSIFVGIAVVIAIWIGASI